MLLVLALAGITSMLNLVDVDGGHFNDDMGSELTYGTACWWVFITISTIGYGDIYPISSLMRLWAIIISLIGIAFLALYTAIIVNGFTQEFQRRRLLGEDGGALSSGADLEEDKKIKKLIIENKNLKKEIKDLKNNK